MKKTVQTILGAVAVLTIIFLVAHSFTWKDLQAVLALFSWQTFLLLGVMWLILSTLKALRLFFLLRINDTPLPFLRTSKAFIASQVFTPLPGGEVGRVALLHREQLAATEKLISPVLFQALTELWTAGIWVIIGALIQEDPFEDLIGIPIVFLLALSSLILFPGWLLHVFAFIKKRTQGRFAFVSATKHVEALRSSPMLKPKHARAWLSVFMSGLASQFVAGIMLWYIAKVAGLELSIFAAVFTASLGTLIQGVMAFIPGGIGVTEGGLIGVLRALSISWEGSVAVTAMYRLMTFVCSVLIGALMLFAFYRKKQAVSLIADSSGLES